MILFFGNPQEHIFAVESPRPFSDKDTQKLRWLFNGPFISKASLDAFFIGPRATMVTPWSTNAVEITRNMGIEGILRIEVFIATTETSNDHDPMLFQKYIGLHQDIFTINKLPDPILNIDDISLYNTQQGLALNDDEVEYLETLAKKLGRKLTDSEVFGFSQVNSEHCRHKIFNGTFIIDGVSMPSSLFALIKKTAEENPNTIISAYKDNVAFIKGPEVIQFAPKTPDRPDIYEEKPFQSVISLKAETHNFPTTVEPFNGAATGSGGEIRDRLAGGKGSIPLAGTAVYMTAYPRLLESRSWENAMKARPWLYQTPKDILIKASNGASDFGNKFGQPLIAGSVFTFEHEEHGRKLGYDKAIMLAGGIGYGKMDQSEKAIPETGDPIIVMGGDNYRIGMGGAAVSSADTGEFSNGIELNAIQRSNPEMQKRVANAIRAFVERDHSTIVSIHDHGAGGHLNCLSELVAETGGIIDMDKLPIGDPTLSAKEIIGNESQERMGLVIKKKDANLLERTAARERAPIYEVGQTTGDHHFSFQSSSKNEKPIALSINDMFGSTPKSIIQDQKTTTTYAEITYHQKHITSYLKQVLQLEAVACKDWLTNKVDRCVTGRVAKQQCAGPLQLPLNNVGVMALDYYGKEGIATAIGHAPIGALIDPVAGSRNSIAEALTNMIWAPLKDGLKSVSLSANWMWPCKNKGEDARLYDAVKACSDFAIALGINIPTGKDSLSMKQKYVNEEVIAPGTVIISAAGHCEDINNVIEPVFQKNGGSIYYINLSQDTFTLGGSSLGQVLGAVGQHVPTIQDVAIFKTTFNCIQALIKNNAIIAGHDIASGGLITTLLELCFASNDIGADIDLSELQETDNIKLLFAENTGIVFQARDDHDVNTYLDKNNIKYHKIGIVKNQAVLSIKNEETTFDFHIPEYRDIWYTTSFMLDQQQSGLKKAQERFNNYKEQSLHYIFPKKFTGKRPEAIQRPKIKAAILREKGSNSEREMANAMHMAGFEVKDVHMTDLVSGRETLEDIQFIGAVGGFSNSDVLGSAKGWAGAFMYNDKAKTALQRFFSRKDTLSLGVCNGCQLFMELGVLFPDHDEKPKMLHNDSHKFECIFTSVDILPNPSIMLGPMAGARLGIWSAHGEGKFYFPYEESKYNIVAKFGYDAYPANPNGSNFNTAMLVSEDGRHLVTMPHFERSIFPWNWAYYPNVNHDEVSPWIEGFINARKWLEKM